MGAHALRVILGIAAAVGAAGIAARLAAQDPAPIPQLPPGAAAIELVAPTEDWGGLARVFADSGDAMPRPAEPWSLDGETPYVQRLGLGYDAGDGLGWQNGMTTLEFTTPIKGDQVWDNLFGDARFVILNDATTAANLGIGYRTYNLDQNRCRVARPAGRLSRECLHPRRRPARRAGAGPVRRPPADHQSR
jgi:hypothetical protein